MAHAAGATDLQALLRLEDGAVLGESWLANALGRLLEITSVDSVPAGSTVETVDGLRPGWAGTEQSPPPGVVATGQSLSIPLTCRVRYTAPGQAESVTADVNLYLKTVDAASADPARVLLGAAGGLQPAAKLRRDLQSCLNEMEFYQHVAPMLAAAHAVRIPAVVHAGAKANLAEEHGDASLYDARMVLLLEGMPPSEYIQHAPLSAVEAEATLGLLADLHGFGHENDQLLSLAREKLQSPTYWRLDRRGEEEMRRAPAVWGAFCANFTGASSQATEILSQPQVAALGQRLVDIGGWVHSQLHRDAAGRSEPGMPMTLVHGDAKAMNCFLARDCSVRGAVLIDFQWAGVGLGMLDVAMHMYHSVDVRVMEEEGGEARLLGHYYNRLVDRIGPAKASQYTFEQATRHYRLALVDYARVVVSYFLAGATPVTFEERKDRANSSLVYRSLDACLRFVRRVDECLSEFETERMAEKQ